MKCYVSLKKQKQAVFIFSINFKIRLFWNTSIFEIRPFLKYCTVRRSVPVQKFKSPPWSCKVDGPDSKFSQDHRTRLGSAWSTLVHAPKLREVCRCIAVICMRPYNYAPIVILGTSSERILGSGSCKTSCTMLKKVIFLLGRLPSDSKPRT